MANPLLIRFIKQGRKRGFDDYQLREPLIKNGWDIRDIEEAFASFKQPLKFKNKISIWLDNDILKIIEKRANRNLMTVGEQIEDIIRRSAINAKPSKNQEKLDDKFIAFFSRKKR